MEPAHKFPKPLWNNTGTTVQLSGQIAESYEKKLYEPGDIVYAPNAKHAEALGHMGFSERYVPREFPKALHGPDGQSIPVRNEDELQRALNVGWQLRPVVEFETPVDTPPSPDRGPRPKMDAPIEKRGPGRPPKVLTAS